MATYVNDLRLKEITTGDESGTWGTSTNTNLELIAEAFSYGTEVITTNADTHTTTIADGATDPGRALYLKYTGTLDSACTITIGPDTVSKVWIIENGTSGSQNIIISQGSGADITIPAGDTKVVYSDGAGAGAAFFDAFASLSVVDLKVQDDLTVTGDASIGGDATITGTLGVTGVFTGTSLDISGDIDVDGTTNLDVVDIDGAVDMASTLAVGGVVTANAGVVVDNFTLDGTTLALSSGNFTVDVAGNIILDADSGEIEFKDGGTTFGNIAKSGNDLRINQSIQDGDIVFRGNDGGSIITALTLDLSEAGAATFNAGGTFGGAVLAGASVNNFAPNKLVTGENTDGEAGLNIQTSATGTGYVLFGDGAGAAAYRGQIRYSQTNDSMNFHTVTTTRMTIDSSGRVTMPYQPAFYATPSSAQLNMAANDSNVTVAMGTEIFDVGSNFASSTFTAPVTGKYQLNLSLYLTSVDTAASYIAIGIITSNRNYINIVAPKYASDPAYLTQNISTLADMDAGDTAYVYYQQNGGTAQTDVQDDTRGSFFQGYLVA
jgi:hypothetical protein